MTKQEAYAELRKKIDAVNEALDEARKFADANDLVMTHKQNKTRPYPGEEDEEERFDYEYWGDIRPLLTVRTVREKDVKDWNDPMEVYDAESGLDYAWLPSSIKC